MQFDVIVKKQKHGAITETINIDRLQKLDGIGKEDIWEYNDIFSKIISDHREDPAYLFSSTLTRIEGITIFYESVCRYIFCVMNAEKSNRNILYTGLDYKAARALISHMRDLGYGVEFNRVKIFLYETKERVKFLCNVPRTLLLTGIFVLISRLLLKRTRKRKFDYGFLTFYDYRSLRNGEHYEQYFDPLLRWLLGKKKDIIVFNQILNYNKIGAFIRHAKEIRRTKCDYHNTVWYLYADFFDIVTSMSHGLLARPEVSGSISFKGYDITYIVRLGLAEDLHRLAWYYGHLAYRISTNMFGRFDIGKLFYPYENHSWEKALVCARNASGGRTKLVAFQHTSFSFKLLQYFPGLYESSMKIYPDKLLTVGKILRDVMSMHGHYPAGIVMEGCALRHPYLFSKTAGHFSSDKKSKAIAYAFSFDIKNYKRILKALMDICEGMDIKVYLRYHPINLGYADSINGLPPNFIDARDMSWNEIFKKIDILFYDDNSLCVEGLRNNVRVSYFALAEQVYDTDRLFLYEKNKTVADSVEHARDFLRAYYEGVNAEDTANAEAQYNNSYLERYFSPIDDRSLERFL